MPNLIIQDTFEPYYADRDDDAKRRAKPRQAGKTKSGKSKSERGAEGKIALPKEAPGAQVRRDRRAVSH